MRKRLDTHAWKNASGARTDVNAARSTAFTVFEFAENRREILSSRSRFQLGRTRIARGLCDEKIKAPPGLRIRWICARHCRRDSSGRTKSIPLNAKTTASNESSAKTARFAASATRNSTPGNFARQASTMAGALSTPTYRAARLARYGVVRPPPTPRSSTALPMGMYDSKSRLSQAVR